MYFILGDTLIPKKSVDNFFLIINSDMHRHSFPVMKYFFYNLILGTISYEIHHYSIVLIIVFLDILNYYSYEYRSLTFVFVEDPNDCVDSWWVGFSINLCFIWSGLSSTVSVSEVLWSTLKDWVLGFHFEISPLSPRELFSIGVYLTFVISDCIIPFFLMITPSNKFRICLLYGN